MKKHIMKYLLLLFSFVVIFNLSGQEHFTVGGDSSDAPINPGQFNQELFQKVFFHKINSYLNNLRLEGFEPHSLLETAAKEHAIMMAETDNAGLEKDIRGYRTIRERLISVGGTGIGSEVVLRVNVIVSNEYISYEEFANDCLFRLMSSAGYSQELLSQKYFFAGINAQFDEGGRRAYVSFYMGNYASFKQGEHLILELAMPPTTKEYGLRTYDEDICERVLRRIPNYIDWQQGLSISEYGEIIFKHDDLRGFNRIITDRRDGLAVDIIQKSQFSDCRTQNIVDYSNFNIGVMTKRLWANQIYKNNIAAGEGARDRISSLNVVLGHLPEILRKEDIELNLIIIKDRYVCANIPPSYIDNNIYNYVKQTTLLPDTIVPHGVPKYLPAISSSEFNFKVHFEKGKYDYDKNEIKPVLATLNEPTLNLNSVFITAYSSLEGAEKDNEVLQRRRAESITGAMEKESGKKIPVDTIITASNWEALRDDVKGTNYENILDMTYEEAAIFATENAEELERFFKNHRYVDIKIIVTYNIEGKKEQEFVINEFNNAVQTKNLNLALLIQKYIFKKIVSGEYTSHAVSDMRIPQGEDYVGLNMNKIWLTQFKFMDPLNENYCEQIRELKRLYGFNQYVEYNDILCEINFSDLSDEETVNTLQRRIDRMYNTRINEKTVDALNIELQYKIMDIYIDLLGFEHPRIDNSLRKIKDIISFDDISWQNSLKLAGIFINNGNYLYAIKLLEPWITQEDVAIDLVRTYIAVCSKIQYKVHSNNFYNALIRLKNHNKTEFCNLFNDDKLSIQTFINDKVKQLYCKECR